jgi:hypothetical protein
VRNRELLILPAGHFMLIWKEFVTEMSRTCKKSRGMAELPVAF